MRSGVKTLVAVVTGVAAVAGVGFPATAQTPAATVTPGGYVPVTAVRLLDTRTGLGAPAHPVGRDATVAVQVTGRAGVPATGVSAVVLNVTVTAASAAGLVTAYPHGTPRPLASSLNYGAGQTLANLVVVGVGPGGAVDLHVTSVGDVQLLADVSGYYVTGPPAAGGFGPLAPTRLLDTRTGVGADPHPVPAAGTVVLQVDGRGGVPSAGVAAVALNVTVTAPTSSGLVTVYPDGTSRPPTSNLNYRPGQTLANLVVARLSAGGAVDLYNSSAGTAQLVADVSGYYLSGASGTGSYVALTPARVLDTRSGLGAPKHPAGPDATVTLAAAQSGGLPAAGVSAVVLNVTVTSPTASGFVTLGPDGAARPAASTLNFVAGATVANLAVVTVGADGKVDLYNRSPGSTQIIADVLGYVAASTPAALTWQPPTVADPAGGSLRSVSCGSVAFCVAVDAPGRAFVDAAGTWSAGTTIDSGGLQAVSCASASFCAAVGYSSVVTYNGAGWTAPAVVDPGSNFLAVSCASTTFCAAVDVAGRALTYNGTTWGAPVAVDPVALTSVSCASATFCVAIDDNRGVVRFNGTVWSPVSTVFVSSSNTSAVDCPSATFCVAVAGGEVFTFNATTWTPVTSPIPGFGFMAVSCASASSCVTQSDDSFHTWVLTNGTTWSSVSGVGVRGSLSCVTATFCVAAGGLGAAGLTGGVSQFDGAAWTAPQTIDVNDDGHLRAVSCATTTFCAAVDENGLVTTFNGATWSRPALIDPVLSDTAGDIMSVSCPVVTFCMAVDTKGQAITYDGVSWSAPVPVTFVVLQSVSCASASFCVAVDNSTDAYVFNSGAWSPSGSVDAGSNGFSSVSCPTATFCAAADGSGQVLTYNGTSWTAPLVVNPSSLDITSISCPTATDCTAVDNVGEAMRLRGTTWSPPVSVDGASYLKSVSCSAAATCQAVDLDGNVVPILDGVGGTATSIEHLAHLQAIACPAPAFCVAVNEIGQAYVGS